MSTLMAGVGLAQQRLNFLAVDGSLLDEVGPYYFTSYGDSSNAYAKAAPFAEALEVNLTYDGAQDRLLFEAGGTRAVWRITSDVKAGLQRSDDAFTVDGQPFARAVPHAILVDGTSYVPISPLVEAFGGRSEWSSEARVIAVDSAEVGAPDPGASGVAEPRIGRHDGFVRVALEVPNDVTPELRVGDDTLALVLPGMRLPPLDQRGGPEPLTRLYGRQVDGEAALMLEVSHAVDANGAGYRMGRTAGGVTYLDVGPSLQGDPATGPVPATARPTPAAARPRPERTPTVVIDAGHGGHDPGTVSSWAQEKEIVLNVATLLAERLRDAGVEVILTRDQDEFLTLQERSTFATTERNVFVSIHANAAPNRQAQGIETWVFGRPLDPSLIDRAIRENGGGELGATLTAQAADSADIAGDILRETQLNYSLGLANRVQNALVSATGARDRGVRQNLFYVIRTARIPAILVELGFVSNPEEGRRLTQASYQQTLADALADGMLNFLRGGGTELAER
ncbi:MAG: N-acetylmuramoyl-L-alanine amidase [Trueperaceae bacterium]|nr:N-acetylmuramoyl-L-alanine amidase [Trueperaceae bacterium]